MSKCLDDNCNLQPMAKSIDSEFKEQGRQIIMFLEIFSGHKITISLTKTLIAFSFHRTARSINGPRHIFKRMHFTD